SFLTLAVPTFRWEHAYAPPLMGVGLVESRTFDPAHWRPYLPNPAFDEGTERDLRWGARIVAGFSDDLIRAAVECGRYSDPNAADYLTNVLIERRDKVAAEWLTPDEIAATRARFEASADPPSGDVDGAAGAEDAASPDSAGGLEAASDSTRSATSPDSVSG